jgi:hypothetical protein
MIQSFYGVCMDKRLVSVSRQLLSNISRTTSLSIIKGGSDECCLYRDIILSVRLPDNLTTTTTGICKCS